MVFRQGPIPHQTLLRFAAPVAVALKVFAWALRDRSLDLCFTIAFISVAFCVVPYHLRLEQSRTEALVGLLRASR